MGLAVSAHQTGPVHAKDHMKLLQSHIVDQHIVAPLQKGGVHGENRDHPLLGHAGSHGNAVTLRNAHIEKPLREHVMKTF